MECVENCPEGAIFTSEDGVVKTDWASCKQCLTCTKFCLYGAREVVGKSVEIDELTEEVYSDRVFYNNTGGGVTISGGEPLLQHEFVAALLKECKSERIHTAIETSGYGPRSAIENIMQYVDLVLFDIKHLDPLKHRQGTGVDNDGILSNVGFVAGRVKTWFRVPLIADFNDSPDHMEALAQMAKKLGIEKISLLPYYEGGMSKASQIGIKYPVPDARSPDESRIKELIHIASLHGIQATVGH